MNKDELEIGLEIFYLSGNTVRKGTITGYNHSYDDKLLGIKIKNGPWKGIPKNKVLGLVQEFVERPER